MPARVRQIISTCFSSFTLANAFRFSRSVPWSLTFEEVFSLPGNPSALQDLVGDAVDVEVLSRPAEGTSIITLIDGLCTRSEARLSLMLDAHETLVQARVLYPHGHGSFKALSLMAYLRSEQVLCFVADWTDPTGQEMTVAEAALRIRAGAALPLIQTGTPSSAVTFLG